MHLSYTKPLEQLNFARPPGTPGTTQRGLIPTGKTQRLSEPRVEQVCSEGSTATSAALCNLCNFTLPLPTAMELKNPTSLEKGMLWDMQRTKWHSLTVSLVLQNRPTNFPRLHRQVFFFYPRHNGSFKLHTAQLQTREGAT